MGIMKLFITAALVAMISAKCKVGTSYVGFEDEKCSKPTGIKFIAGPNEAASTGTCVDQGAGSQYTDCAADAFFTHTFPKQKCQGKELSYIEYAYGKCVKLPDGKFAKVTQ